jgi:hypothetical protein
MSLPNLENIRRRTLTRLASLARLVLKNGASTADAPVKFLPELKSCRDGHGLLWQ